MQKLSLWPVFKMFGLCIEWKLTITHRKLFCIMKCALLVQVNQCKPFQHLYQKLNQHCKLFQQCWTQTFCFVVGSTVGVSPPLSTGDDWVAIWHYVLMQSAKASKRDCRGGARDCWAPARVTKCCLLMLGGRDREIVRKGSVDMVKTTQKGTCQCHVRDEAVMGWGRKDYKGRKQEEEKGTRLWNRRQGGRHKEWDGEI